MSKPFALQKTWQNISSNPSKFSDLWKREVLEINYPTQYLFFPNSLSIIFASSTIVERKNNFVAFLTQETLQSKRVTKMFLSERMSPKTLSWNREQKHCRQKRPNKLDLLNDKLSKLNWKILLKTVLCILEKTWFSSTFFAPSSNK